MFYEETHLSLFPEPALDGNELAEVSHGAAEPSENAVEFALTLIRFKWPSANDFIMEMSRAFGFEIRLSIVDIIEAIRGRTDRRKLLEYIDTQLSPELLHSAMGGVHPPRQGNESTLDELFQKTLDMRSPAKLQEVMRFVAKIREYSVFNNTLVYLQRPTANYWATKKHWGKEFGRTIKGGALPIVILRPRGPVMLVYDIDDTEGKPVPPQLLSPFPVAGNLDPHIYERTIINCGRLGIIVKEVSLRPGHAGMAIYQGNSKAKKLTIEINEAFELRAKYATLCHEIGHIYLGHLGGDPYGKEWSARTGLTRTQSELEAEAVAYLVCFRANLTTRSAEYLTGYLRGVEDLKKISIESIMKTAGFVERMGTENVYPRPVKK